MAPTATKKVAPAASASKTSTSVKVASESAPSKGRMEGDRKGKESNGHQGRGKPSSAIESAAELPERADRGAARRGGRQAATNQPTRNLDRHSRMANKEGGEKRQYGGKSGWGNPADAKEAVAEANEATAVSPAAEDDSAVVEETPAANYMTLGQYLAEQEKKKPAVAAPKARSANDGAKVAGEVVKKDQDMYFQTAKPVVNNAKPTKAAAAKPVAAAAAKSTKFSLQELNAVIPGGLARPPRPVREESSQAQRGGRQQGGRRFENNASKPEAVAPTAKAANLKDDRAFPTL